MSGKCWMPEDSYSQLLEAKTATIVFKTLIFNFLSLCSKFILFSNNYLKKKREREKKNICFEFFYFLLSLDLIFPLTYFILSSFLFFYLFFDILQLKIFIILTQIQLFRENIYWVKIVIRSAAQKSDFTQRKTAVFDVSWWSWKV